MSTSRPPAAEPSGKDSIARVLGAWGSAAAVWLVGFTIVARLASRAPSGEFSDFDRLVRLDLPWVVISILMVVAAGTVHRDRTRRTRWFAAVLTMPLLVTVAGVAAPAGGDGDAFSTVLYLAEGVAGAAIGLAVAAVIGVRRDAHGGYW